MRGIAATPDGGHARTGVGVGFVLDGSGGLHWFWFGPNRRAPTFTDAPYWPGRDIARGVALLPDGSVGYVVDAAGVLYPFGINGPAPALPSVPGFVAARGVMPVPASLPLPPAAPVGPCCRPVAFRVAGLTSS